MTILHIYETIYCTIRGSVPAEVARPIIFISLLLARTWPQITLLVIEEAAAAATFVAAGSLVTHGAEVSFVGGFRPMRKKIQIAFNFVTLLISLYTSPCKGGV